MTPTEHIDRADQYVSRAPDIAQAHAMIALAKLLAAHLTPDPVPTARESIARDCGTADQWAELAHERRRLGVGQQAIAEGMGCSVPYLSQLERGVRPDTRGWHSLAAAVLDSITGGDA